MSANSYVNSTGHDTEARSELENEFARRTFLKLLPGRSEIQSLGVRRSQTAISRLESYISQCPDVDMRRFAGMSIHAEIDDHVYGEMVHAIVECGSTTWLINVHDDPRRYAVATLLLNAAAVQLGFQSQVISSELLERPPHWFQSLMILAADQHTDDAGNDVEDLAARSLEKSQTTPSSDLHFPVRIFRPVWRSQVGAAARPIVERAFSKLKSRMRPSSAFLSEEQVDSLRTRFDSRADRRVSVVAGSTDLPDVTTAAPDQSITAAINRCNDTPQAPCKA